MQAAAALLLAALSSAQAPPPEPRVDVWRVEVTIDADGTPKLGTPQRYEGFASSIAPCASRDALDRAHAAELPPPPEDSRTNRETARDAVLTTLDADGRAICARIYSVPIDRAIEVPPSPDGNAPMHWISTREFPLTFSAYLPASEAFPAIRVSGWRGLQQKTFAFARCP